MLASTAEQQGIIRPVLWRLESFSGSRGRMMLCDPIVIARSGQGPLLVAFKLLNGICVRSLR